MYHLKSPKKQTQTKPISPTPKGVKQKSDAGSQRSDICLLSSVFCFLSIGTRYAIQHLLCPVFSAKIFGFPDKVSTPKRRK